MENEMVTISARIPKRLNSELERFAKSRGYASKTEVLRQLLRAELYKDIADMKGALKGKVAPPKLSMGAWRKQIWQRALQKANGDKWKAIGIIEENEKKMLKKMGLEDI